MDFIRSRFWSVGSTDGLIDRIIFADDPDPYFTLT